MKAAFRSLLIFLLTYTQAFAGAPVIWSGTRSQALTSKGLLLSDGSIVDNDGFENVVKNGHAEIDVTGWSAYADAAGATPVDCTGGSPNETVTRTTTTPLYGSGSILLTKDAANRQGEGISYAFTLPTGYTSQSVAITMTASPSAGYVANDLRVYIYDVTGASIITPDSVNIGTGVTQFQASFTSTTSTSYRLCIHTATTNASSYTVKFDRVLIGFMGAANVAASSSSNGYVSTGTQTFAGDKTFNGTLYPSGGIVGRTDGASATAGNVGEIISSTVSSVVANVTAGPTAGATSAAALSLTAGNWLIIGGFAWYSSTNTNTGLINCGIEIYNSTDAAVINQNQNISVDIGTTGNTQGQNSISAFTRLTGSKTVQLRIRADNVSGSPSQGGCTTRANSNNSAFYAVRIY